MAPSYWYAQLAVRVAIAALIIPSHALAQSSGEAGGRAAVTGAGAASSSAGTSGSPRDTNIGVAPLRDDSTGTNPATDTEIQRTTLPDISGSQPQTNTGAQIGTPAGTGRKHVRAGAVTPKTSDGNSRASDGASKMQNCMAAWDERTHMSQDRWRETCARTLDEHF